jgi:hypothetical protein
METALAMFRSMTVVLDALEVDPARATALLTPTIDATDAVYRLVRQGTPFRDAYRAIAADPAAAVAAPPGSGWRDRTHLGAPGALDLAPYRDRLAAAARHREAWQERVGGAWGLFDEP